MCNTLLNGKHRFVWHMAIKLLYKRMLYGMVNKYNTK